jgi:hypothetical protein
MKTSPVLVSDSLDAWTQSESLQHHGMLVTRPELCTMWDIQADVDDFAVAEKFGSNGAKLYEDVKNGDPKELLQNLQHASNVILAKASLPKGISEQIHDDICAVGSVVGQMCSNAGQLQIKLQVMGANVCSRWHRDYYVGRAIVTYNSHATHYTADSNVDMWEMENCGKNECVIRDPTQVHSAGVGDILFMKGAAFPQSTGLVHKSPEVRHHEDGRVINRLILKVDVEMP